MERYINMAHTCLQTPSPSLGLHTSLTSHDLPTPNSHPNSTAFAMHSILSLSLFLALPPFSFALPAPSSPPFDITWYVTSFEVLDGSATNTPSYASFTFVDPRPEYHFNISCFGFPSSGDSVFSPRMRRCGSAPDNVHVRITDGEVQFRRSWQSQS